jgi:transcriptional regulator with XRE-family HTH domain
MPDFTQSLLNEIIEAGRKLGLDQKDIVRLAGLGTTTLSKAKAANDLRVSTLTKLANAVGLKIALTSNQPNLEKILRRDVFTQSGLNDRHEH